jgi:hypothetical protein
MDSATGARGGHVEIKQGYSPDSYDKALGSAITSYFPGRADSGGIRYRSDLANVNRAATCGINYRLLECCFITSDADLSKFNSNLDSVAALILGAFGINTTVKEDADMSCTKEEAAKAVVDEIKSVTDDPTGRGKNLDIFVHTKWIAATVTDIKDNLAAVADSIQSLTTLIQENIDKDED